VISTRAARAVCIAVAVLATATCSSSAPKAEPAPSTIVPSTASSSTTRVASTTTRPEPPPLDRALDLVRGTAFGFTPGNDIKPQVVLDVVTRVLGPPTRDTGWYTTKSLGPDDCLGHNRQRILRWGSLSFAFWHPQAVQFTLWNWSLGDSSDDQREPHPIVARPIIAATTADGLGVGTSLTAVQRRYGAKVSVADDKSRASIQYGAGSVNLFLAHGQVSGMQSRLSFC
jgi:hypothetical protein